MYIHDVELGDVDGDEGDGDPDSGPGGGMFAREEDKDVSGVVVVVGGDGDDGVDNGGVSGAELVVSNAVVLPPERTSVGNDSATSSSADAVVTTSPAKSATEATCRNSFIFDLIPCSFCFALFFRFPLLGAFVFARAFRYSIPASQYPISHRECSREINIPPTTNTVCQSRPKKANRRAPQKQPSYQQRIWTHEVPFRSSS